MILTETALQALRNTLVQNAASARYKANGSYYTTSIALAEITAEGRVNISLLMEDPLGVTVNITEVQLLNHNGVPIASKAENITRESPQQSIYYRFSFYIQEV
jgi:hypothetical protein